MRYRVLGPIELFCEGDLVRLGGPKQRAVLALLLLHANRVVPEQRFVSAVWGDDPPSSVRGQLQMYVSQLRKLIGEPVIVRRPPGYLIEVRPGELDLDVFDERVRQARADLAAGRTAEATEAFRSALALWRGPVLGDATEPLLERHGPVLRERRLAVLEEYFDVQLAAGRHDVRELRAAAEENPLRERLQAQLMLALHGSGRTTEGLEVYAVTRSRLVAEQGVEPGSLLRDAQARLLRDEDQAPDVLVPRQLPGEVPVFAGRVAELARLDALVDGGNPVAVITGGAGVGKTTLAVHWAHRIGQRFPDGQLYANLRGFDPGQNEAAPDDVVRVFLEALGVPVTGIPAGTQARFSLYRSLLAGKRVLVLLDNARDAEQVRPLLPGSPGCLTIVTSRDQLPSLIAVEGAAPVTLGLLPAREARDMLAGRLGADRVDAEPAAVEQLVALCGRLPLALAIVAARAAIHPAFSLASLTDEMTGDLDAFDSGDPATGVRAVFSWSYRTLSLRAARLFRLLGLHPGPHVTLAAAASLLGEPVPAVRSLLAELTRANLVTEPQPGRFGCHDLLRAYATELAGTVDPAAARAAAVGRLLDHYVHTAHVTDRFLRRHLAPEPVPTPAGVTVADVRTEQQAVSWYGAEYEVLGAAVELAARTGFDSHAWPLACALSSTFWHGGARWLCGPEVYETALAAAERLDDPVARAFAHRARAVFRLTQRRMEDAEDDLTEALRFLEQVDDLDQRADVHQKLAWVHGQRADYAGELRHAETALGLFRKAGNQGGMAVAYNNVAWSLAHLGDHEQAVVLCKQALAIFAETGERKVAAATWDTMGFAYADRGQYDEAVSCYRQAIELHRMVDSKLSLARTHERIGDIHLAHDATDEARESWQQARDLFEELILPDRAERVRLRLARLAGMTEPDPAKADPKRFRRII